MKKLKNKVIITTRPNDEHDTLSKYLRAEGASVIEMPMIEISPVEISIKTKKYFHNINKYNWLIFTSKNGVIYFFQLLENITGSRELPHTVKTAVVGKKTAEELKKNGVEPTLVSSGNTSEALLNELKTRYIQKNEKVLLALGNLAGDILEKGISDFCEVSRINVYKTTKPGYVDKKVLQRISNQNYDIIIFTSPSGFNNFISFIEKEKHLKNLKIASIGKTTDSAILNKGYRPLITAKVSDADGLIHEIIEYFKQTNIT